LAWIRAKRCFSAIRASHWCCYWISFRATCSAGTARAFATDAKAREVSRHAIASGFDRKLPQVMRMFLYLPFEHSEHLSDQMESVRMAFAMEEDYCKSPQSTAIRKSAEMHHETIRRFGRFPGRNEALGRQSTKAEIEFRKQVNTPL
jgi:uncharacterized protein (DUF924 family)